MSIIVEGPDGAGKTTLVQELQGHFPQMELHPRFCTSKDGPIENLTEEVFKDVKARPTHFIYDRHPTISEFIYNTSIPNRAIRPAFLTDAMGRLRQRVARHSVTVWCLPPLSVVKQNTAADELEGNQMAGVAANIERIYEQYQMHRIMWPGCSVLFNYTYHSASWEALRYTLSEHQHKLWKDAP